jgi:hypothetical protein
LQYIPSPPSKRGIGIRRLRRDQRSGGKALAGVG